MIVLQSAVRGKYGFYPCDYETFRELKKYHGLLLRAYKQFRAFQRWAAKKGANRYTQPRHPRSLGGQPIGDPIPLLRPTYPQCAARIAEGYLLGWGGPDDNTPTYLREFPEFQSHGGINLHRHVLDVYRRARRPVAAPEDVVPLDLPQSWKVQLIALRAHYSQ